MTVPTSFRIPVPVELDRDALRDLLVRMLGSGYLFKRPTGVREVRRRIVDYVTSNGVISEDETEWGDLEPDELEYVDLLASRLMRDDSGTRPAAR